MPSTPEFGLHPRLRDVRVQRDYLELLGHLVYRVSGLEHLALGDLNAAQPAIAGLDMADLMGRTTTGMGRRLDQLAPTWTSRPAVHAFATLAAQALIDTGQRRNDVLHARPAWVGGAHRLVRDDQPKNGPARQFTITTNHLVDACAAVDHWHEQLYQIRFV